MKSIYKKIIMKAFTNVILLAVLTAGAFNSANAQRGRDNAGRGNRESNVSPQRENRSFSETRTFRQSNVSRNNSFTATQRNERSFTPNRSEATRSYPQRNATTRNDIIRNDIRSNRSVTVARQNNAVASSAYNRDRMNTSRSYHPNGDGNYRYNNNYKYNNYKYNNYYHYNNKYYGGGYYIYNHRSYCFMYGPHYTVIPGSYISINFGGYPYYYNSGLFYGYYGGYYQPIFPPFGIQIGVLPFGYYSFYLGGYPYYYYNGIYYQQHDNSYQVVDAPMGASVYNLPQGAKSVTLNGEKLYELNGTYYKEDRDSKGQTIYTVVGKNGEVNNTNEGNVNGNDNNNSDNADVAPSSLQLGDILTQLPEGSKVVTINGEKMYVTPDDIYLKEETHGSAEEFEVVGK